MLGQEQRAADENFGMWTIENVQDSDAGQYRCEGNYAFGSDSATIELVVLSKSSLNNYYYVCEASSDSAK